MTQEKPRIYFCPNGNTAVFRDGEQQTALQRPWAVVFAELMEAFGHDPTEYMVLFPNGHYARFFRTSDGEWNWRFEEQRK